MIEPPVSEARNAIRVLVTGAAGHIGGQVVPALIDRFNVRLLDCEIADDLYGVDDVWRGDLSNPDRSSYAAAFEDIDVVVHLAYMRSSPGGVYDPAVPHIDRFDVEQRNVTMAYNVYRAAFEAGVRRVVVGSSNHATDWYEHELIHAGALDTLTTDAMPLSDNFYGWSKASYELLSFPFACGTFGRSVEMVHIRIGAPKPVDADDHIGRMPRAGPGPRLPAGHAGLMRDLGAYLSPEDAQQLFTLAISAPDVRNAHGIPWLVVYGVSDNTRAFWSIDSARDVLGYTPRINSEVRFADQIDRWLPRKGASQQGDDDDGD